MELPNRQGLRLKYFSYNNSGSYFITICTKDKREILSKITGSISLTEKPKVELLKYGKTADKYINELNSFYDDISIDKFVIMPNHIHLLITVSATESTLKCDNPFKKEDNTNSKISKLVSTFKRFCNKEFGENIWQSRYFDHVIRCEKDYRETWMYIDQNPRRWIEKRCN